MNVFRDRFLNGVERESEQDWFSKVSGSIIKGRYRFRYRCDRFRPAIHLVFSNPNRTVVDRVPARLIAYGISRVTVGVSGASLRNPDNRYMLSRT